MDRGSPSEQSSLPYNLTDISSDTEEVYSAHQSQADVYPGNLQSSGTEVSSITPGSYPFYQFGLWDGSEYLSIQRSVPSTPNDRTQFYPQPPFPSNDLSHTHDRVLDSFFEGRLASIQAHRAAGLGRTNFRIVREGTVDHLEAQGGSGSDPLGSSSTTIADTSSSLSDDGFYSQYGVQDDHPRATSSFRGQVEGAALSHAVTQGQDAAKREVLRRRQQKIQEKRERDRIRKGIDRAGDDRAYSRVCKLLAIRLDPKNTRSQRILKGVESIDQDFERMCELLEISMTPRKTVTHRVLNVIERLVERQKLDNDLRRRFEESEAKVVRLETKLAQYSTESDTGSGLPMNTLIAEGSLDIGASL